MKARLRGGLSDNNVRRLIALAAMSVIAVVIVYSLNHSETAAVSKRVTRIETKSPCLAYPNSKLCHRSFSAAIRTVTPNQVCTLFAVVNVTPADCEAIERRHAAAQAQIDPQEASAAPSPHATAEPALPHTKGGEAPPTGSHDEPAPPVKGAPPVPEPTGPAPPQSEAGTAAPPPPETVTTPPPVALPDASVIESIGGKVCSTLRGLGVALCP